MGLPKFSEEDFLAAGLAIVASAGPSAMTVASISERLGSPTGSFYHRFASRDVVLGELWLRAVLAFQVGITVALDAGDGLRAALHTPAWARANMDNARLLLLYDRRDFIRGDWPSGLRQRVTAMTQQMEDGARRRARIIFRRDGPEEIRLAEFLISEVPVAVVRQHLLRGERPPPLVDQLIRATYRAILADYQSRKSAPRVVRK
jgi:AcrR family transcriptional regulator